jgi:hypothetical protein
MFAVEIAQYLASQGLGTFEPLAIGGTIYIESQPPDPDEVVTIRGTGGNKYMAALPYNKPTIQILVRGTRQSPVSAEQTAVGICRALISLHNERIISGGTWVVGCQAMQSSPTHIGVDKNSRHEYSQNFEFDTLDSERQEVH